MASLSISVHLLESGKNVQCPYQSHLSEPPSSILYFRRAYKQDIRQLIHAVAVEAYRFVQSRQFYQVHLQSKYPELWDLHRESL